MSDPADRAQAREEEIRSDALADHARHCRAAESLVSARACAVCDEAIPVERRAALPGVQTCVECQRDIEHAQGWGLF